MKASTLIAACFVTAGIASTALADPARGKGEERGARMFSMMDTNKDGAITQAEMRAARGQTFVRLDGDKNGVLTKAERDAARDGRGGGRSKNGERHADANKDGNVTRAEWDSQPMKMFARMDANRDGTITQAEAQAIRGGRRPA